MDRRNAIMALSGILASSALVAMPRHPVFARTKAEFGEAKEITPLEYKTQTLQVGTFSKETSQLATAQAIHPKVKQFAQFEVNEQTAMAQVLTDVNNPPPVPSIGNTQRCFSNCKANQARLLTLLIFRDRSSATSSCLTSSKPS